MQRLPWRQGLPCRSPVRAVLRVLRLQGLAPDADISATKHKIEDLRRGCCHPQVFDSAIRAKVREPYLAFSAPIPRCDGIYSLLKHLCKLYVRFSFVPSRTRAWTPRHLAPT